MSSTFLKVFCCQQIVKESPSRHNRRKIEKMMIEITEHIRYTTRKRSFLKGAGYVASCLAAEGKSVLCIDADIGLRNLDIALGMAEQSILAFTDVMLGHYTLNEATPHPSIERLYMLTAPVRENDKLIDAAAFGRLLNAARAKFDFCLIDAPAGIGTGFQLASRYADRCLLVSTPDPASMRDAARAADVLLLRGKEELHLVVNRAQPKLFSRMSLTVDDMMDQVGLPLLGIVPEDANVVLAAAQGMALILATDGGAAEACLRISHRLCGELLPLMKL